MLRGCDRLGLAELKELSVVADSSPMIRVRVLLCQYQEKFEEAFAIYMGNARIRGEVFTWLDEVLETLRTQA